MNDVLFSIAETEAEETIWVGHSIGGQLQYPFVGLLISFGDYFTTTVKRD